MQKGSVSPEAARWAAQPSLPVGTPPLTPSGAQTQPDCAAISLAASRHPAGRLRKDDKWALGEWQRMHKVGRRAALAKQQAAGGAPHLRPPAAAVGLVLACCQ